jgi:hypothetical protein
MNRWALLIDIEGFSKIFPENMFQALKPLGSLMEGIYYIGTKVCPDEPNRLFAHQTGDGFILVSEYAERSPGMPIAIGVFLMRQILLAGGMGKCAISQGEFGDIRSCYPDVITKNCDENGRLRLGGGLMHFYPVMGSALINCYGLTKPESGSLLLIDSDLLESLSPDLVVSKVTSKYFVLDWVHTHIKELIEIEFKTGINHPDYKKLEELVKKYTSSNRSSLSDTWVNNTLFLNGC